MAAEDSSVQGIVAVGDAVAVGVQPRPDVRRMWVYPVVVITGIALTLFAVVYSLDWFLFSVGREPGLGALANYLTFESELITDALPALGMTIVAVLGIVLTVVTIIVQLSSDRYTGVAMMFMRDRINIGMMSYFVITAVCAIWLSVSLHAEFVPRLALLGVMLAAGLGMALMLPYFAYVFWFLEPGNIIQRIRYHATQFAQRGSGTEDADVAARNQERVLNAMEEITDIANNSIAGRDKIIASRAVDALRDFVLDYLAYKPDHDHTWFRIVKGIRENPDFVAMDPETMHELELRWTWVEWKALRQYLGVYNEALASMQDINYLIAIDTRYIGEAAARRGNRELVEMVLRFMNSYLRSAINARATRTAYNVLHQYRMLIESLLRLDQADAAIDGVAFLKYYGHVSFDDNLTFVTETIAYDLAALCEYAHGIGAPQEDRILKQFLELDRPTRGHRQERGLRGVRKAQTKLAAYYLSVGAEDKARLIAQDMLAEPADLLHSIRDELAAVETRYFWENVDRGRNFEYLPPEQRARLDTFFSWLDAAPPPRRRATDR